MEVIINPGPISGPVHAPASKSHTQRVFAAALLHHGKTIINNAGMSADEIAALEIIAQLGATVNRHPGHIEIIGNGINTEHGFISCHESGLAARLFTPIAALSLNPVEIKGSGSLLNRPMDTFNTILPELGVKLLHFNGHIPFTVAGPLIPASIKVDGSLSSQFLSGLLFAICYRAKEPLTIEVENLKSTPYIDLTLEVLRHFGKHITHDSYRFFHIDPTLFIYQYDIHIDVEGDWSNAAYWLVAGAINGNIKVKGLSLQSVQADKAILQLLADIKARITISEDEITVRTSDLEPFEFDATHCPDLFPILAILAACCDGDSYITGMHRLHHKESNRAESVAEMLLQFEVPFSIEDDTLCITGTNGLERTTIDSYNDHRIVMAASIGALRANGPVNITGAEAVNKSYPHFFEQLSALGAHCTINK
ncbi:MAG: 3-phosphoshikimate 1-carboxyvinyltransferase [Flavipsychrobacter sp.]|nr:3-phosphoshikimate 1-carboxyvinyltransferase [Flavipsychrobacter sp.]